MFLRVKDLKKYFYESPFLGLVGKQRVLRAVDGVSFDLGPAEVLGLAGESGCGKTTTAKVIAGLLRATSGEVNLLGKNIFDLNREETKKYRRSIQMIFQDPEASLNPRKTVESILCQPYLVHKICGKAEAKDKVLELLERVGLTPPEEYIGKHPHELSGGEKQRVGIARSIALSPKLILADEPVASLDMSIRGMILTLMKDLQKQYHLSYLFITHDLQVIRAMCDRVAMMYLGKIVELAETEMIFEDPRHPYTKALLSANPIADPVLAREKKRIILAGDVPSASNPPSGCRFHPRCAHLLGRCSVDEPQMVEVIKGHFVSCFLT